VGAVVGAIVSAPYVPWGKSRNEPWLGPDDALREAAYRRRRKACRTNMEAQVLEKILVGYGGDQAGRDAAALAGTLAAVAGGRLTVVFPYHPLLARVDAAAVEGRVGAEVAKILAEARVVASPRPTLRWSSSAWPIHALHELARYEEAELIVFGAAKEDLGDRLHLSLMERMVHGAPCAVAVAPQGFQARPFRRIGVGFAASPEGRMAAELACELASRSGGSVQVIAGAGLEPALASYAFSSPALVEVEEEIYEQTQAELDRFCEDYSGGATLERETIRGEPAGVLVERSAELDLLVLGSRAYGPLRHALLGSVSARAMREARCPVLVVPRGVAAGDEHGSEQRAGAAQFG
jgi:nucleotide-binding universal stress UspA family protein